MDLIVVLVMGMQTREAVRSAMCIADEHTYCLTLQNGVGNVEILEEFFPDDRLLFGVMPYGGEVLGPGSVKTMTGKGDKSHFWQLRLRGAKRVYGGIRGMYAQPRAGVLRRAQVSR